MRTCPVLIFIRDLGEDKIEILPGPVWMWFTAQIYSLHLVRLAEWHLTSVGYWCHTPFLKTSLGYGLLKKIPTIVENVGCSVDVFYARHTFFSFPKRAVIILLSLL